MRRGIVPALALVMIAAVARAEGTADVAIDFDGDAVADRSASDAAASLATAALPFETMRVPDLPEGEQRNADATGRADGGALTLHCECGVDETPRATCDAAITRDDFMLVGDPGPNRIVSYTMRVVGLFEYQFLGESPSAAGILSLFFRLDPFGPGSRVRWDTVWDASGTAGEVGVEVGQIVFVETTPTRFEALVRRSKSVAVNTPFSFEAELQTICQSTPFGTVDAAVAAIADARDFTWEAPDGYVLVPEPGACAYGGVAVLALALRSRASS